MATLPPSGTAKARPRKSRGRRRAPSPFRQRLQRWQNHAILVRRALDATPPAIRVMVIAAVMLGIFALTNLIYQVVRKPTEMFFPVGTAWNKMPAETWREYGPIFRKYSTPTITADLLAALAQVEAAGNPVARTYWRWRLTWEPFSIYRPASSAVGMFQMTDPAFADARRYCVRNHAVTDDCWFNGLYSRVVPSHAVELTAVMLDRNVAAILSRLPGSRPSLQQKQELATLVHLCGAGPAQSFARHHFHLPLGERCGDHGAAVYLARVNAMKRQFQRLAAE